VSGADWSAGNYYDRAFIYYSAWARTGNPVYWNRGNQMAVNYRKGYLEANNYAPAYHWAQMEGVDAHYALTGDDMSAVAVQKVADYYYYSITSYYQFDNMISSDDRIRSRLLTGLLLAWRLNPTGQAAFAGRPNMAYTSILDDALNKIVATQGADGANRYSVSDCGGTKSFENGLLNDALLRYYRFYNADARIPTYIKKSVDYLWTLWDPTTQGIEYVSVYCVNDGGTDPVTPYPDLNNMIVNGFAFAYATTRDPVYLTRADQMFAASVATAWLTGSKQFNQEYASSFQYLSLRQ